jgi:hypothetical protein
MWLSFPAYKFQQVTPYSIANSPSWYTKESRVESGAQKTRTGEVRESGIL